MNDAVKQPDVLLAEYSERRTEILSTYPQYFSILFGVIPTGILGTFYLAIEKPYLYLTIPMMVLAWFSIALVTPLNIEHITAYIAGIETKINTIIHQNCFCLVSKS